ncbi:DUF3604 domain-containing protein [Martelella lutilitoris]|uniref:DUF3604 domain-containing protein n=1 Tax=Martelella lutilitoris TaxID=2583532 RepID=A0A5C4JVC9_9HYPH|nr:DUF3604 domain-containing protein [Martelella lutilitoris]TNB49418.1 DUF3604 domain-containing protein [Martelella lutilitoris]
MNHSAKTEKPWTAINSGVIRAPIGAEHLGHAVIDPSGAFEAGSYASFTLTYTAGTFGIDDSGSLRVCFRFASDQSSPQFDDPKGANYCTVEASNGAVLQVRFDPKGNVRPWDRTIWIKVAKGYLQEGDRITIRFGVTDHGGPGMRLQTFCEENFEFRVLVDPIATFNFQTLPVQPSIAIVPGRPERFVAVLPTLKRPGERFALKVRGEDKWDNPSNRCNAIFTVEAEGRIEGLPQTLTLSEGPYAFEIDDLVSPEPGRVAITLKDERGNVAARSNPLIIEDRPLMHFWGDMHGQSGETIGTGSAEDYFAFARDRAFVDACGHQGNDFQITDAFWEELNAITARFDAPGRFVAMPGYEWSGNTALGGDRNVFFPDENRIIRRSSKALIEGGADTDCTTANDLFEAFAENREFDVVCYAHCGGRYADIAVAHDGRFEKSVEVHSSWGTFEWLLADALRLGYRVGVVANSDGHKGRPGASYPGAGKFGAIGGLTCFLTTELSRAALLDAMRKRHHYGTSGGHSGRMAIDLAVAFDRPGTLYHDDPKLGPAEGIATTSAMMGDIVHLPEGKARLSVSVLARAPVLKVGLFNGLEHVETIRNYKREDLGNRIRIRWEGAEYRGRFRQVTWDGKASVFENSIVSASPLNFFNHDKTVALAGPRDVEWKAQTTGNFGGVDLVLENGSEGTLSVRTPLVEAELSVAEIGFEGVSFDKSGELPRILSVTRLPDAGIATDIAFTRDLAVRKSGDNAWYIRVELEDGTTAWTSPVYLFRE